MSNRSWFEDADVIELCEQCECCPNPNGCIRQCAIASYVLEDIAAIRGENE